MFLKVFLVLETKRTSARIIVSDLMSTLSQYSIFQLESSTTINFAWQKSGGPWLPAPLVSQALFFAPDFYVNTILNTFHD